MGFKDVKILKGGLGAWTNAGLPIDTRSDLSQVGVELYKALAGGNAHPRRGLPPLEAQRSTGRARIRSAPQPAFRIEPDAMRVAEEIVPLLADRDLVTAPGEVAGQLGRVPSLEAQG